jgi:uncharacterized protein with FMN-binding domain
MYCKFAEQAEADFFDTEYGFLPYMGIADGSRTGHQDGDLLADAQIRIPLGPAVKENIDVVMRLGHNAGTTGKEVPYEDYKAKSGDIRFPVEYRFESGDAKKISSKTEWKQFTPTYTKDSTDTVDSIPTMMNMVYGKVQRPSEDYTYLTLRFIPNDVISYMFGDIRLTGDTGWWPTRKSDFVFGEDYMGNQIPVALRTDVENIVAKGCFGYEAAPVVVEEAAPALAANEYIGVGKGFGGDIKVKVTMDGKNIAKIEVLEHGETAGICDAAFAQIPEAVIKAQSTQIDAVTGATFSSNGLIEAINNALAQVK